MKKLLLTLIAVLVLAPSALAGDFDHGQSAEGCYYFSEAQQIVYTKDASGITDKGHCLSARSTIWYIRQTIDAGRVDNAKYWNRINAMKILLAK